VQLSAGWTPRANPASGIDFVDHRAADGTGGRHATPTDTENVGPAAGQYTWYLPRLAQQLGQPQPERLRHRAQSQR